MGLEINPNPAIGHCYYSNLSSFALTSDIQQNFKWANDSWEGGAWRHGIQLPYQFQGLSLLKPKSSKWEHSQVNKSTSLTLSCPQNVFRQNITWFMVIWTPLTYAQPRLILWYTMLFLIKQNVLVLSFDKLLHNCVKLHIWVWKLIYSIAQCSHFLLL